MAMTQQASEMKLHIIYYKRETSSHGYVLEIPQVYIVVKISQRVFLLNNM
jgi:hypothetical protein